MQQDTCGWCNAPIKPPAKVYCGRFCMNKGQKHIENVSIAEERRANRLEKLQKIRALCDALENGAPDYDGARLLDAGLLTWWSVAMSADQHGVYELVTAADRNASVPWALPPPRRGDRAWLIETLREVWVPKARGYLSRQGDGVR